MSSGDTVAIRDPDSGRWRSATVIAVSPLRVTVATWTWWAVVPRSRDAIRPIKLLRKAAAA